MRENLNLTILGLLCCFSVGCSTIYQITSEPTGADVALPGGSVVGQTPYETRPISSFGKNRTFAVKKTGFVEKTITLQSGGATTRHVVLEKYFPKVTVNSVPQGANVYDSVDGLIGQTPLVIHVTNSTHQLTFKLLSYPVQNITLTPRSKEDVTVSMGEQIAGMVHRELMVTEKGIELRSETVFADQNVVETSPSVRAVRRLTDYPITRLVGAMAIFPGSERIIMDVLDQQLDEAGQLVRFSNLWSKENSQDGRLQRWTDGRYFDESACFSPDGNHIYFSSTRSGSFSIFRMSATKKSGLGLVTGGATLDRNPTISPDGLTLLWTAYVPKTTIPQLWSLPLSANGLPDGLPMQLREGKSPKWSPDGTQILYSLLDRNINKWKIWVMKPEGAEPTQITTSSGCNDIDPQWSHDGKRIIFSSDRGVSNGTPNYDIWMMNADGSGLRQLTTNGSRDDKPLISEDGKTVFFRSNRGLKWDVWIMEIVDGVPGKSPKA